MPDESLSDDVTIEGVDLSHVRLVELSQLADQAKPFYMWAEETFQRVLETEEPLDGILRDSSKEQLESCLRRCYLADEQQGLPLLFDGIGRSYPPPESLLLLFLVGSSRRPKTAIRATNSADRQAVAAAEG